MHTVRPRPRALLVASSLVVVAGLIAGSFALFGAPWRSTARAARAQGHPVDGRAPTTANTAPHESLRADWVVAENAKPGTSDWRIAKAPKPGEIEGYADGVSAQQGDTVRLFVSTTAPTYDVEAFRMGYYQGLWGRRVWNITGMPGVRQARPTVTSGVNLIEARWQPSLPVRIDTSWPPGDYLFKLTASTGGQQWIPLTVREDTSRAAFMVMNAVTNWQAYNTWGGCSLYMCPGWNSGGSNSNSNNNGRSSRGNSMIGDATVGSTTTSGIGGATGSSTSTGSTGSGATTSTSGRSGSGSRTRGGSTGSGSGSSSTSSPTGGRAEEVSFDRPYAYGSGAADFTGNELPLVALMETYGFDVTYTTSVDLDRHPELVLQHAALLSLGHDEYWSKAMFDGAQAARDHGVNIAFFGANAIYRQIRLVSSPLGPQRRQINYRSTADPIRRTDPALTTVSWRESPVNRPEQTLIGQQYECNPVRADLVVADPSSWVYAGTGLRKGDHVPITVGTEYDRYDPNVPGPANVEVLAHSPVRCQGRSSYADVTYYTAPGAGGVFASGTNWWISKLNPAGPGNPHEPAIITMTINVLRVFGTGPAGLSHPSVANWQGLPGIRHTRSVTTSTTASSN